jgi:hypothetical protein
MKHTWIAVIFLMAFVLTGAEEAPGQETSYQDEYITAFGYGAGTTGNYGSYFGVQAGTNTTLGFNSFFGYRAGYNNTGALTSSFGYRAGYNNEGWENVYVGKDAGFSNTLGNFNTFAGAYAGYSNTTAQFNSFFGASAGRNNTTAQFNSFFGKSAGEASTAGYNSFFGGEAGMNNTTGYFNAFFGAHAGYFNTTGSHNSYFGTSAGYYTTGHSNSFFGANAGYNSIVGDYNVFIGADVLGKPEDTNTIRIGNPYDTTSEPPTGQYQTFIAGIIENPIDPELNPSVVGVTGDGQLGTISAELLPPGPAGEGLISGSLLFLLPNLTPPDGYVFLGSYAYSLIAPDAKKPTKLTVNVYVKQ